VHAVSDRAALKELLRSLQLGIDRVRQLGAERQTTQGVSPCEPSSLLVCAHGQPRKRRALVVDDYLPEQTRDAGSNDILSHMRALVEHGYQVEFVAAKQTVADVPPRLAGLDAIHLHRAPAVSSVEEVLRRNAGAYELIYLHRPSNASAYSGLARHWCPRAHVLHGVADLHHLRLTRQVPVQAQRKFTARARA
jgi:hypothetical protein